MPPAKTFVTLFIFLHYFTAFGQFRGKHGSSFSYKVSLNKEVKLIAMKFMSDPEHTGLSIGIIRNGVRYIYNYGTIDRNKHIQATAHTIYEIASITKTFTGILLAHAVLEKKIRLNDDVHKYLDGGFENLSYKDIPIKIIDLANHTSGLLKFVPAPGKGLSPAKIVALYNNFSEKRFLEELTKVKIDTLPGTRFSYSNAGPQLIGIILERIYHMSYEDLVKKYITAPANMYDTKLMVSNTDLYRFAKGYDNKGELMPRLSWWHMIPAAGFLKSTVSDMLNYLQLNIYEKNPAILLSHQPTFKISAEGGDHIALYWFIKRSAKGYREIYHAGGSFGSTGYCMVCPEIKTGIVCLANDASQDTEHELTKMSDEIMERLN